MTNVFFVFFFLDILVYEAIVSGCLSIVRDNFNVSLHMLNIMHWLFVTSIDLLYHTLTQFSPCTEKCDYWGLWAPFPVQRSQHPQASPQWVWDYWDVGWTKSVKQQNITICLHMQLSIQSWKCERNSLWNLRSSWQLFTCACSSSLSFFIWTSFLSMPRKSVIL